MLRFQMHTHENSPIGSRGASPAIERRTRRSDDVMTALHYQLAFARDQGGFDALVLADPSGFLVAGAGAWSTCELLAAYAPLLGRGCLSDGPADVEVHEVAIDGTQALLCARGGVSPSDPLLDHTARGCQRILAG
jgi:hypothetical protein